MLQDWNESTVLVTTTDKTYSGELISSDVTGVVIALVNSTQADAPFDTLSEDTRIELWIPIYRLMHVARGQFTGISST